MKVKNRLDSLNVPYERVELSNLPTKKIKIIIDGKTIHFGAKNSQTYLEGASEKKRTAYIARHSKIFLKNGSRAIDRVFSPAWLSFYVLW